MAKEFNVDNLDQEVLKSDKLVLVDFWAEWCGPCRVLGPTIESLSKERDDVVIGKFNVDGNTEFIAKFGIRGIPAILFFKDGEVIDRLVGVHPKRAIEEKIDSLL